MRLHPANVAGWMRLIMISHFQERWFLSACLASKIQKNTNRQSTGTLPKYARAAFDRIRASSGHAAIRFPCFEYLCLQCDFATVLEARLAAPLAQSGAH